VSYIKSLEDELELVTEQLIDTQKMLTQAELKRNESEQSHCQLQMELSKASAKLEEVLEDLTCQTEAFHHLEEEIMIFCH
jgi:septal ring factor EnvC (AmiA/AmiB activator)